MATKLRVTRQMVEVLCVPNHKLRVTRQIVEVLGEYSSGTAASASNSLGLTDMVDATVRRASSVTDDLGLTQTVNVGVGKLVSVEQALGLTHSIDNNFSCVTVSQSLNLNSAVEWHGPKPAGASHILHLVGVAGFNRDIKLRPIQSTLMLLQYAGHGRNVAVTQTLVLVSTARRFTGGYHTLGLTQTTQVGKGGDVDDDAEWLGLTDTVTVQAVLRRGLTDELNLEQAVSYIRIDGGIENRYCPQVGSTTSINAPAPPPTSLAALTPGVTARFQLCYPAVSPTDILSLRAPEFGNKDRLQFTRIKRESRGGTLKVYARSSWPKQQVQVIQISGLAAAQAQSVLAFMENHLGVEIGIMDWEARYWKGVITTPNEPAVADGRDSFTISFTFEGEPSTFVP